MHKEKFLDFLARALGESYLFDRNEERTKSNLMFLNGFLLVTMLVNTVGAMIGRQSADILVMTLIVVAASFSLFLAVQSLSDSKLMLLLSGGFVLLCFWTQMFLCNAGVLTMMIFSLYPIAISFFMGNRMAVPFDVVMLINLLVYSSDAYSIWYTKNISVMTAVDPSASGQAVLLFIFASGLGIAVEFIHNRTALHLVYMANTITENSHRDPLTKLLTRRAFYERYSEEIEGYAKEKPTFVVMCDIDHFKSVNDTYGHATGDEVLRHATRLIREQSNSTMCFRWGGEEFIIFLYVDTLEQAISKANRVRVVLEHEPYDDPHFGSLKFTMSFGVQNYDNKISMEANIAACDTYLYAAKHKGRNRVESVQTHIIQMPT